MFRAALIPLLAWFAFLTAAVGLAARFVPVVNHAVLGVAALSPYLVIGAGLVVMPVLFTRLRWTAVPSLLIVVAMLIIGVAPRLQSDPGAANGASIRVLTVNLHEGSADPTAVIERARDGADLLVLQELTPTFSARLGALNTEFPFRVVDAEQQAQGVGILSRYPIVVSRRDPGFELGMIQASLRVPGVSSEVVVVAIHIVGPWPQAIDGWRREIDRFPGAMTTAGNATPGAVIVAGDFNATTDMERSDAFSRTGSPMRQRSPAPDSCAPSRPTDPYRP